MFGYERTDDRLTLIGDDVRWLSNGVGGGYERSDAAHNLTVPEGFDRTDLTDYVAERLGERPAGPTLLTGVSQSHARCARAGTVEAVVTAGVSNPATLSVPGSSTIDAPNRPDGGFEPGTVNVFVGTTRTLPDSGLAELLATAVEAKTATLLETVGCTGTTSDAVAVGCVPDGDPAPFAGSATPVGNAARVCVRDALCAALDSRYGGSPPDPVTTAEGAETTGAATVFRP
ncbi:adenosylcobinamide amidohydrolase [Natronomonas sp. F2-12]|jgi:adenosylcobinamide hydrolase|uniref:Adenosylcobinamide amidohydrolase n=1 Tax=Natronomonas aquatica TaxID=2841590 RepID=A0A9R1CRX0_9EURY|nr:adenosylcobinamide amidohydrolase [Natronomonas aquatica]MCQ4332586.1 adenosylcobinamide amidohydrolase [Natronomonas aquatica]